jgi:hypothetical protein
LAKNEHNLNQRRGVDLACGKPPVPGGATPAKEHSDYALLQAHHILENIGSLLARGDIGDKLDRSIKSAERAIERLKAAGATDAQLSSLEGELAKLQSGAMEALRKIAEGEDKKTFRNEKRKPPSEVLKAFKDGVTLQAAQKAKDVLAKPGHWAHEAFKKELLRSVEQGVKIPDQYREALPRDVAMLLKVCPNIGGFAAAMITRGQSRDPFAARLSSKNKPRALGAAYEIMAAAALCRKESKPANTGKDRAGNDHKAPKLRIDPVNDKLSFGSKAFLNHRYSEKLGRVSDRPRRSTESDGHFYRPDRGEVGIDMKHTSGPAKGISELRGELKAVAEQIGHGQYNEFHFVSNGEFSDPFKEAVDKVNNLLIERGHRSMEGLVPIAVHEHVTSIDNDPHSKKEVGGSHG